MLKKRQCGFAKCQYVDSYMSACRTWLRSFNQLILDANTEAEVEYRMRQNSKRHRKTGPEVHIIPPELALDTREARWHHEHLRQALPLFLDMCSGLLMSLLVAMFQYVALKRLRPTRTAELSAGSKTFIR